METRADFGSLRPVANTVPHDIDSGPATQTKEEPSVERGVFGSLIHLLGSCHEVMKEQPQASFSHQPLPSPGSRPSDLALNSTRLNLFPCRRHPNSKSLPRYLSISSDPSLLPHQKTSWVPRIKIPKFKQPPGPSPLIFRLQPTAAEKTHSSSDSRLRRPSHNGSSSPAQKYLLNGSQSSPKVGGLGISTEEITVPKQTRRRGVADRRRKPNRTGNPAVPDTHEKVDIVMQIVAER